MRTGAKRRNARGGTAVRLPGAATSFVCFIPLLGGVVVPTTMLGLGNVISVGQRRRDGNAKDQAAPTHGYHAQPASLAMRLFMGEATASLKSEAAQLKQWSATFIGDKQCLAEERGPSA